MQWLNRIYPCRICGATMPGRRLSNHVKWDHEISDAELADMRAIYDTGDHNLSRISRQFGRTPTAVRHALGVPTRQGMGRPRRSGPPPRQPKKPSLWKRILGRLRH